MLIITLIAFLISYLLLNSLLFEMFNTHHIIRDELAERSLTQKILNLFMPSLRLILCAALFILYSAMFTLILFQPNDIEFYIIFACLIVFIIAFFALSYKYNQFKANACKIICLPGYLYQLCVIKMYKMVDHKLRTIDIFEHLNESSCVDYLFIYNMRGILIFPILVTLYKIYKKKSEIKKAMNAEWQSLNRTKNRIQTFPIPDCSIEKLKDEKDSLGARISILKNFLDAKMNIMVDLYAIIQRKELQFQLNKTMNPKCDFGEDYMIAFNKYIKALQLETLDINDEQRFENIEAMCDIFDRFYIFSKELPCDMHRAFTNIKIKPLDCLEQLALFVRMTIKYKFVCLTNNTFNNIPNRIYVSINMQQSNEIKPCFWTKKENHILFNQELKCQLSLEQWQQSFILKTYSLLLPCEINTDIAQFTYYKGGITKYVTISGNDPSYFEKLSRDFLIPQKKLKMRWQQENKLQQMVANHLPLVIYNMEKRLHKAKFMHHYKISQEIFDLMHKPQYLNLGLK